ncbi:MAG: GNAT family N-acetyltransferase [Candidatus Tectomicrobia bacterium]|nr:GNAT family N-acetyltransferase [Candidatus Tectomicrobia bacterium]
MSKIIQVKTPEDLERFCALPGPDALAPEILARRRADAHWMFIDEASHIVARCSLWWNATPLYPGHHLGLIGHYAAYDPKAAAQLFILASEQLAAQGCTMAVGPMDGNTWQRYRLLTERGTEPTFFLEPDNPDDWPTHFTDNGFSPLAHYLSALNTDLSQGDPRVRKVAERIEDHGIRIRSLTLDTFEDELRRIYDMTVVGFRSNFLYTPLSESDFVAQYLPIRPYIRPELVLIVEFHDSPIGFIFAIPDISQTRWGQTVDRVIIKTMAVLPEYVGIGLGSLLIARCQEIAKNLGYTRAIHALMYEKNISRNISAHYAKPMRRYTLFARILQESL